MDVTPELIDRLRERLRAAAYTLDAVSDRLGSAGVAGLARNTTLAAAHALGDADDPQATLIRLWLLQQAVPASAVAAALGDADALVRAGLLCADGGSVRDADALVRGGLLCADGGSARDGDVLVRGGLLCADGGSARDGDVLVRGGLLCADAGSAHDADADSSPRTDPPLRTDVLLRAEVEIRPYAAAGREANDSGAAVPAFEGWVCHDLIPTLDGRIDPVRPDFVLGLSPASTTLAEMTMRRAVGRALDLGTGCGVQALHLAQHAREVVATDLNPRALELADLTARLNGLDVDLRLGSLYEPVAGERFDLIVTNPPYVMSPPTGERLVYREGLLTGDELVRRVVTDGAELLAENGVLQVLGNWAIVAGEPWQDRLRSWIVPTGCDALVLQRERLDPYEYIEIWLNDAGLTGTPAYAERYRAWVDYFAALGIEGVGMGWIALRRTAAATPHVQIEEWPHAVHQPVGDAFAAFFAGLDALRSVVPPRPFPDRALLDVPWLLDPRVGQETLGRPGAEDPEHVVLRQGYGFGRASEVDTALGAVLGACDGDLPAGRLVAAVADLLEVDAEALASEIAPQLRRLVIDGWLTIPR